MVAGNPGVRVEMEDQAEPVGDADAVCVVGAVSFLAQPAGEPQRRAVLGVGDVLEGRHLDGLVLGDHEGAPVTEERHGDGDHEAHGDRPEHRRARKPQMALLEHVVGAYAGGHETAGDESRRDGVDEARRRRWVERGAEEAGEHRPAVLDLVAGRRLHPGVGDEDPQGGEHRADPHQPGGHVVEASGHPLAPEQKDAEEGRLEEEGDQTLGGEGRPEDVADEA